MKKMLALVSLCVIATQAFAQGPFSSLIFGGAARSGAGLLGRGLFAEAAAAEVAAAEGIAARGAMRSFSGMGRGWLVAEEGVIAAESRAFAPMSRGFFRSGGSRFGSAALATEEGVIAAESRLATRGAMRGMGRGLLAAEEGVIAAETRVLAHPMSRAGGSLFRRGGSGGLLSAEAEAAVAAETRIASHPMAQGGSRLALPLNQTPNAGGAIRSFVTAEERVFYRVFSDRPTGRFLTSTRPTDRAFAREGLALPSENKALFYQEVRVPAGIRLQRSRALPAFGKRGGLEQFELLEQIPTSSFGAAIPLK